MRHLADDRDVVVDPYAARVDLTRGTVSSDDVAGPDRGGQPVRGVVGQVDRLVVGVERQDHQHRPEHLVVPDRCCDVDAGDQGGLVVGTAGERAARCPAAADDLGPPRTRCLDVGGHPVAVGVAHQRTLVGRLVVGVAQPDGRHQVGDAADEVVDQRAVHDRARRCGAVLAAVDQRPGHRAVHRRLEVGVVEHDERRLAPQLQVHALGARGGQAHHPAPDGRAAGERHHRHVGVGDEVLAGVWAGADDDTQQPVRQAGGRGCLRQGECGQRRQLAGLQDDGVAGGQRRQHLPTGHLQRVVPRGDRPDDTDGLAPDAGGVVGRVLADGPALEQPCRAREEAGVVDRAGHVELAAQPDRLAGLRGLGLGQLLGDRVELSGQPVQDAGPLAGRRRPPRRLRTTGRGDCVVDVGRCRQPQGHHRLTGGRVDHLVQVAGAETPIAVEPLVPGCRTVHAHLLEDHGGPAIEWPLMGLILAPHAVPTAHVLSISSVLSADRSEIVTENRSQLSRFAMTCLIRV